MPRGRAVGDGGSCLDLGVVIPKELWRYSRTLLGVCRRVGVKQVGRDVRIGGDSLVEDSYEENIIDLGG